MRVDFDGEGNAENDLARLWIDAAQQQVSHKRAGANDRFREVVGVLANCEEHYASAGRANWPDAQGGPVPWREGN